MRAPTVAAALALAAIGLIALARSPAAEALFNAPPYHGGFCADWRPPEWAAQAHCLILPWQPHYGRE